MYVDYIPFKWFVIFWSRPQVRHNNIIIMYVIRSPSMQVSQMCLAGEVNPYFPRLKQVGHSNEILYLVVIIHTHSLGQLSRVDT